MHQHSRNTILTNAKYTAYNKVVIYINNVVLINAHIRTAAPRPRIIFKFGAHSNCSNARDQETLSGKDIQP